MKKATRQQTRAHNKRLVLRTIYQEAGGTPSILLSIAAGSGNLIGVDRANSQLRGGVLYLCGNFIDHQAITFSDDHRSPAFEHVMELIDTLLIDCKGPVLDIGTGFILRAYEAGDH